MSQHKADEPKDLALPTAIIARSPSRLTVWKPQYTLPVAAVVWWLGKKLAKTLLKRELSPVSKRKNKDVHHHYVVYRSITIRQAFRSRLD